MKRFNKLGGVEVRWRYTKDIPYGGGRKGTRKIDPLFYEQMNAAFLELWVLSGLGPADSIISAGAYAGPNRGRHTEGRAIDIDAIHWGGYDLVTMEYPQQQSFYLGCEAVFRRYVGTVLGFVYNADHHGHWHLDNGSKVCYRESSESRVKFVQASLKHVWGYGASVGPVDGDAGTKTHRAITRITKQIGLKGPLTVGSVWHHYLMCTAVHGCALLD